jgi:hypothetical protein
VFLKGHSITLISSIRTLCSREIQVWSPNLIGFSISVQGFLGGAEINLGRVPNPLKGVDNDGLSIDHETFYI